MEYLKAFIERIENLDNEKTTILNDIKEVYFEAKSHGYDNKIMREIIKQRKLDQAELEEQETLIELYQKALGMK